TRSFLVENEHTVKNDGQLDNAKPWWPRNYNPKEISPAAIDHRGIRMRQRALSFGLAHFLRALNDAELIAEGTKAHIDDVTNLASLRLHDRMMEDEFETRDSSFNLEELKPAYLYAKGNTSDILYGRITKMELIGLWFAEAPIKD
ncbi:hypothetical protein, partial [Moraxella catarrhalis]|uniref:hypothetical protein n=1 Tax=Moraxella catarrhalis TaxID=480 RepID=UPI0013D275B8